MIGRITIELKDLRFYSHHGLYAEEKKIGGEFGVDAAIAYTPISGTVTDISETINYVSLYNLIKAQMDEPRELLETLSMEIAEAIHSSFRGIKRVEVSITKLHPPMPSFQGKVSVSYSKEF